MSAPPIDDFSTPLDPGFAGGPECGGLRLQRLGPD
jgi:hypothetical protein